MILQLLFLSLSGMCFFSFNDAALMILPQQFTTRDTLTRPAFFPGRRWRTGILASKDDGIIGSQEPPLVIHHTAIKTRNITLAMEFYSLLGFQVTTRFQAGPARAAWLEFDSHPEDPGCRLELIEVPSFLLQEPEGMRRQAMDLMARQELLGHNHFALDVSEQIDASANANLTTWIQALNQTSLERSNRMLRMALEPRQQMIGRGVYELAFLYDADGALVELLNKQSELEQEVQSGWEPWDGGGFQQE